MRLTNNPVVAAISAPSGCGKDTIIERVLKRLSGAALSVSHTTRPPRSKEGGGMEQHGIDYFFVDDAAFAEQVRSGEMLEHAEIHGHLYGTSRAGVRALAERGCDLIILNIETHGAMQVKAADPSAVTIFILPPSAQELRRRLVARSTDEPEDVEKRMGEAPAQVKMAYAYDYIVMNDNLDDAVEEVVHILSAAKRRAYLNKQLIDQVNRSFE